MTSVSDSWRRIEAWLAHNSPQVLAALRPPAAQEQIAHLESATGLKLSQDVRQSFLIHDGSSDFGLISGNELLSLQHAAGEWEFWVDFVESGQADGWATEPDAGVREGWFRRGWLPLTYDGAGDHACLDLDPGEGGQPGQIIEFWHDADDRKIVAPSFGAWLCQFADELERGAYNVNSNGWLEP